MAKNKNTAKKNNNYKTVQNRKDVLNSGMYATEMSSVVKCIVIVLIIFGLFYLLANYITKKSVADYITKTNDKSTIQYDEILSGQSFNKKDDSYLVLFYNVKTNPVYTDLFSNYQAKDNHEPIYYVDLSNRMNQNCIATESNKDATNSNELKISGPTLIKFTNNQITDYIEGEEDITSYLE